MNRIARALTALIVAAGLTTAVAVTTQADAASGSVSAGDHAWCC
ncbi:MAG: hypothetical protein ACTHKG_04990 [Nocardioides sp.]